MNEKTEKTLNRLAVVRQELAALDSSLALLQAFSTGKLSLQGKGYTRKAETYHQTPADKARLPWTKANLEEQRRLLACELAVLLEYGA